MSPELLDIARKLLCKTHLELETDEERLAYLRGYMSGASHRDEIASRVKEHEDLVFRIASENARKHGEGIISFEDCVSVGYEALMHRITRGNPSRSLVASAIRIAIIEEVRSRIGRDGHEHKPNRIALAMAEDKLDSDGISLTLRVMTRESSDGRDISETLAALDLSPKERAVCSYTAHGFNLRETGEAVGLSEGRVCQILKAVGRKHGERLTGLLACEELIEGKA